MCDFPNNPSDGAVVTHPNGTMYRFDGMHWDIVQDDLATLTARVAHLESILLNHLILE